MDNRVFNVNGSGDDQLLATLKLVFNQEGHKTTCKGWRVTPEHGLILLWHANNKNVIAFPNGLSALECFPFVSAWLLGDDAKKTQLTGWDEDYEHDGSNSRGWRVYCEDWGHVASHFEAICAIKPVYLWHGK